MYAGKPVVGIIGGIGSGKSHVAGLFGELGCLVISSDDQVREAYQDPAILNVLREWWGGSVFTPDGRANRSAIASIVFARPGERVRLERLLHPWVNAARARLMDSAADEPDVRAFIWDTPLLAETGLDSQCDAVVFVEAPESLRLRRVMQSRGWDAAELARREKLQWPLDTKRGLADDVITNTADADAVAGTKAGQPDSSRTDVRDQVRKTLSRILAGSVRRLPFA